jgi:hypothetical protein
MTSCAFSVPSRDAQRYSWQMTEDAAPQQSDEMVRLQETVDSMKVKPRGILGASLYSVISDVDELEKNTHYLGEYVVHLLDRIEQLERKLADK